MESLKLVTLNLRGLLKSNSKRHELNELIRNEHIDILLLQETHIHSNSLVNDIKIACQTHKCYFSFGTNNSRGVGIIVFNENIDILQYHHDMDGRLLYIDCTYFDIKFRIINIYAPVNHEERVLFFKDLYKYLTCNHYLLLAGDFNCITDRNLDKIGGNLDKGGVGSDVLRDIADTFAVSDAFRHIDPHSKTTTWCSKDVSCRLDRFYVSNLILNSITSCKNIPFGHSDHDAVKLTLENFSKITFGSGYWKFNNSILEDKAYITSFTKFWALATENLETSLENWDILKSKIKDFTVQYCIKKQKTRFSVIKQLEREYRNLNYHENKSPGDYIDRINALKTQIKEIQEENYRGSIIRSKAKNLNEDEKLSNYFFKREVKRAKSKTITKITEESSQYENSGEILAAFKKFYSKLYSSEDIDQEMCDFFLQDVPKLDPTDVSVCEGHLTKEELFLALKQMENNKSPGSDGLTKEFYFRFFDLLSDWILAVANLAYDVGSLSKSQKMSYITLLCKDKAHSEEMKNYRPISLLNYDYKIISKSICNRMSLVLENIIHPDQVCAVKGRTIFDNLHLLRDIVDYVDQKDLPLAFISLDQEKAFDRVNYDFMFRTLSAFNFGPSLIQWVKTLYSDIKSSVIVNNYISDTFDVTRGVRQGCSLSPLLYVLILEPFAIKVREDPEISGIKLPGSKTEVKVSLYADDSTGICTNDFSIKKLLTWCDRYGKASGAKLNYRKTKGLWLGKWKTRSDHPFGISWADKAKILGIYFGKNVTHDDNWNPIFVKFQKILNSYKQRSLCYKEKVLVINCLAASLIWYPASVILMPGHYLAQFQRAMFLFLWGTTRTEPLKRSVTIRPFLSGGLNVVHIPSKIKALHIKHIIKMLLHENIVHRPFFLYWLGLQLRKLKPDIFDLNAPHADVLPSFYDMCHRNFKDLINDKEFFEKHNDLTKVTSKHIYSFIIDKIADLPNIEKVFPLVDFKSVYKLLHHKFIQKHSRDLLYRIIHEILPVNYIKKSFQLYKFNFCDLCKIKSNIETIEHLFIHCPIATPLIRIVETWLNIITSGKISHITLDLIRLHSFPELESNYHTSICLLVLTELLPVIWFFRCSCKYDRKNYNSYALILSYINRIIIRIKADYLRLPLDEFCKYWIECGKDIFVKRCTDDELDLFVKI